MLQSTDAVPHFVWGQHHENGTRDRCQGKKLTQWAEEKQKKHVARTRRNWLWISETEDTALSLILGARQEEGVRVRK